MKKQVFVSAVILSSCLAFGGTGDVGSSETQNSLPDVNGRIILRDDNLLIKLGVVGTGSYVCSAETAFKHIPVLGRGQTRKEAAIVALNECRNADPDNAFFCKRVEACEKDTQNGDSISAVFDIVRNGSDGHTGIGISFSGKVKYQCIAEGWGGVQYLAKAPTKVEAAALAKIICADDEAVRTGKEPNAFFCDVNPHRDCEQIEGVEGSVGIGDFFDFFKKKKN